MLIKIRTPLWSLHGAFTRYIGRWICTAGTPPHEQILYGLYLPNMIWRELDNFSSGSVCLVLASEVYDEEDYIRDYEKFYEITQKNGQTYNKILNTSK